MSVDKLTRGRKKRKKIFKVAPSIAQMVHFTRTIAFVVQANSYAIVLFLQWLIVSDRKKSINFIFR